MMTVLEGLYMAADEVLPSAKDDLRERHPFPRDETWNYQFECHVILRSYKASSFF